MPSTLCSCLTWCRCAQDGIQVRFAAYKTTSSGAPAQARTICLTTRCCTAKSTCSLPRPALPENPRSTASTICRAATSTADTRICCTSGTPALPRVPHISRKAAPVESSFWAACCRGALEPLATVVRPNNATTTTRNTTAHVTSNRRTIEQTCCNRKRAVEQTAGSTQPRLEQHPSEWARAMATHACIAQPYDR